MGWIVLGALVLLVATAGGIFNRLVALRNRAAGAWADIDVQLKRRHDLVENLVETVRGYVTHERDTLEGVVRARNQAESARSSGNTKETAAAEGALTAQIRSLFALAEAYPQLKADTRFADLHRSLEGLETEIQNARRMEMATLYRNDGGDVFTDIGASAGVAFPYDVGTATWADYNGDGSVDLVLPGWVFKNLGNGSFTDATAETHLGTLANVGNQNTPRFADFDHDGDLDVAVRVPSGRSDLLTNEGGVFNSAGAPFWPNTGFRSPVAADYDNDGDLDLASSSSGGSLRLYRNELAATNHWLQVALQPANHQSPIGAKVRVVHGSTRQTKQIGLGDPAFSQDDLVAHFGLGNATAIDSFIVRWPDGTIEMVIPVPTVDQTVTIQQRTFTAATPSGSGVEVTLGPATVTFSSVAVAGESRLELADSGPSPPWGLQILPSSSPTYYDLSTAAQFSGPVEICLEYDPSGLVDPESTLRLLHYDASLQTPAWVDVTTSIDEVGNVICGSALTLSPFAVVAADPTDVSENLPLAYRLHANVPNPFNPTTTIRYEVPHGVQVRLDVLTISGQLVRTLVNQYIDGGRHQAHWDGLGRSGRLSEWCSSSSIFATSDRRSATNGGPRFQTEPDPDDNASNEPSGRPDLRRQARGCRPQRRLWKTFCTSSSCSSLSMSFSTEVA